MACLLGLARLLRYAERAYCHIQARQPLSIWLLRAAQPLALDYKARAAARVGFALQPD
jgi:hypothetical protein